MFSKNSSNVLVTRQFGIVIPQHKTSPRFSSLHGHLTPPKRHGVQREPSVKCCCCNLRAAFIQIKLFMENMNGPAGSTSVGHISFTPKTASSEAHYCWGTAPHLGGGSPGSSTPEEPQQKWWQVVPKSNPKAMRIHLFTEGLPGWRDWDNDLRAQPVNLNRMTLYRGSYRFLLCASFVQLCKAGYSMPSFPPPHISIIS